MPYWCGECRTYFSVRTGTPLQHSRVPLRKWVFAVYLYVTHLKGVSSMKLHRDIRVTQKTAWFMLHRLRKVWSVVGLDSMSGPVEIDETYVGGRRKNMSNSKRKELAKLGYRGTMGKAIVVGAKDRKTKRVRAEVVHEVNRSELRRFVAMVVDRNVIVYTDNHAGYDGLPNPHEVVAHSRGEYVRGDVHTNGIEGFWSMFKRAHVGTYHKMSEKHLQRYVDEFAGRQSVRETDTERQMTGMVAGMVGKRLLYKDLTAD